MDLPLCLNFYSQFSEGYYTFPLTLILISTILLFFFLLILVSYYSLLIISYSKVNKIKLLKSTIEDIINTYTLSFNFILLLYLIII